MRVKIFFASAILALLVRTPGLAQDSVPVNLDLGAEEKVAASGERSARQENVYGRRVRYVKVEGRWGDRVPLPLHAGDVLSPENLSATMNALRVAITAPAGRAVALRSKGEVGVLYLDATFETAPGVDANGNASRAADTVGVTLRPHYVQISLVQIGNNILPIPRSPWPAFYDKAPPWLLALNPTAGTSYDRAFGATVSLGVAADLLRLWRVADNRQHFDLSAEGTKSLEESFYRASGGMRYSLRSDSGMLREFSAVADFDGTEEPLGGNVRTHHSGRAALGVKLKLAPNFRLALDAGYQRADDELGNPLSSFGATSNQETGRLLLEAIPPGIEGFFRAAVWQESAWQNAGDPYQRVVGRLGYEKEISIAQNQTVGIELIAGAGRVSSGAPGFARFFGGNSPGQFLYDGSDAASLTRLPSGPILRSFGENEARLPGADRLTSGGDTFWHVNLNVTIPIRWWSRSLIPNEMTDIEDAQGRPVSIKHVLTQQINGTGPSMLQAVLKQEGLNEEEAQRQAQDVFREITPATRFIIQDANLYSLKPLLMFDAAGLSDRAGRSETWLAAGGGLQFTVVTAKLEAGYLRTLSGPRQGHDGNAFVRLVFQNLF